MARPLRIEYPHAFYHVLSRGNERKAIFKEEADYQLFLKTLEDVSDYYRIKIHSYCLMPNHIHLLIETPEPNLSQAMKRLFGVYTIRFNRKHKRHGHLFQGRYKALIVDKDSYLLPLSRYIHLNPWKAKLVQNPTHYRWSSLPYFIKNDNPSFLEKSLILGFFESNKDYLKFVLEKTDPKEDFFNKAVGGLFLGTDDFIRKFKEKLHGSRHQQISRGKILARLAVKDGADYLKNYDRNFQIYCQCRLLQIPQQEIGVSFGITYSAVSHLVKRYEEKIHQDKKLRGEFERIKLQISNFKN